jgi:LAO/AO transport system kinase
MDWESLLRSIIEGDAKALARSISLVENEAEGYEDLMQALLPNTSCSVIGITGPPGAGKSTLTDALIGAFLEDNKKVGVICVDPSSPFNLGALLGDRIRMSEWYNNPDVFIRSLATKGSLGGLNPKIIEITDVMKAAGFDYVIIETVGVGQSEVEIAGLADTTIVVLVPEAGDEIQTMKAGLMEIADIFVVNKSDRPDADLFVKNLHSMLRPDKNNMSETPIIKTVASRREGVNELKAKVYELGKNRTNDRKHLLLTEKIYHLIGNRKMKHISKSELRTSVESALKSGDFNLYKFLQPYID